MADDVQYTMDKLAPTFRQLRDLKAFSEV